MGGVRLFSRGLLAGVIVALVLALAAAFAIGTNHPEQAEQQKVGVFAQGGITIGPGQTVDKLLVVDGDAVITGKVTRRLVVAGGSVILRDGGEVRGAVIVLGGIVRSEGGAINSAFPQLVVARGSPHIATLAGLILLAGILFLLAGIRVLRLLAGWLGRLGLYQWLRNIIMTYRQQWPAIYILSGFAISGFLLALFVHLAEETIFQSEADLVDRVVIWLVRYYASPGLDRVMLFITSFGAGYAYVVFAPLVVGLLYCRRRREASALAICLSGAALLNFLLKHLFERARPDLFRVISETGYSFPSGHAMVSLCFYGMLAYLICRHTPHLVQRLLVYALVAALVTAIGLSRIYLGVHYPSDVLAGYFAGGMWLAFCVSLLWWWEQEKERENPLP